LIKNLQYNSSKYQIPVTSFYSTIT